MLHLCAECELNCSSCIHAVSSIVELLHSLSYFEYVLTQTQYAGWDNDTTESGAAKGASQSTMDAFLGKAKPEKSQ